MYLIAIAIFAVIAGFQLDADCEDWMPQSDRILPIGLGGTCRCFNWTMPMCGTNNVTYTNICHLNCASRSNRTVQLACFGKCPCRCHCLSGIGSPVCGSDGNTYQNYCSFRCAKLFYNRSLRVSCWKSCPC